MRKDMARVVTEKPRRGSSAPNRKSGLCLRAKDLDEDNDSPGPAKLPMAMGSKYDASGWNSKDFSDVLGPLRKWLMSQAKRKRPWSKVYSEIREAMPNRASQPVRHVWEAHLMYEIALHCRVGEDGKVYELGRYSGGTDYEKRWQRVEGTFYVHPITGLFLWAPYKRRKKTVKPVTMVKLDELTELQKTNGIWYHVRFARTGIPENPVIQLTKRQLGKKELREFELQNDR